MKYNYFGVIMKKIKHLTVVLFLTLSTILLVACSGGGKESQVVGTYTNSEQTVIINKDKTASVFGYNSIGDDTTETFDATWKIEDDMLIIDVEGAPSLKASIAQDDLSSLTFERTEDMRGGNSWSNATLSK